MGGGLVVGGLTGLAASRWAAVTVGMGNECNVIKKVKSASKGRRSHASASSLEQK